MGRSISPRSIYLLLIYAKPKQMSRQSTNDEEMTNAIQLLEAQSQLMQLMAQNQVNNRNKELPQGMQQLLDNQTHIVQMMCHNMANSNVNSPHIDIDNEEFKGSTLTKPQACKTCGEIGHTSKECHDEWPHGVSSYPTDGCPTTLVTCFLCEATNHVPTQCRHYPMVQEVSQQVKAAMQ